MIGRIRDGWIRNHMDVRRRHFKEKVNVSSAMPNSTKSLRHSHRLDAEFKYVNIHQLYIKFAMSAYYIQSDVFSHSMQSIISINVHVMKSRYVKVLHA